MASVVLNGMTNYSHVFLTHRLVELYMYAALQIKISFSSEKTTHVFITRKIRKAFLIEGLFPLNPTIFISFNLHGDIL